MVIREKQTSTYGCSGLDPTEDTERSMSTVHAPECREVLQWARSTEDTERPDQAALEILLTSVAVSSIRPRILKAEFGGPRIRRSPALQWARSDRGY